MLTDSIIAHTKQWITDVVIGCKFCPFAAKEVARNSIAYEVVMNGQQKFVLQKLISFFDKMQTDASIETLLLILPTGYGQFAIYLKLLKAANALLKKAGYEGVYQLASFHPDYLFAESRFDDPANYTNRSPYPVIQILRESSITRAVETYPDTLTIPQRNATFANEKGLAFMKELLRNTKRQSNEKNGEK